MSDADLRALERAAASGLVDATRALAARSRSVPLAELARVAAASTRRGGHAGAEGDAALLAGARAVMAALPVLAVVAAWEAAWEAGETDSPVYTPWNVESPSRWRSWRRFEGPVNVAARAFARAGRHDGATVLGEVLRRLVPSTPQGVDEAVRRSCGIVRAIDRGDAECGVPGTVARCRFDDSRHPLDTPFPVFEEGWGRVRVRLSIPDASSASVELLVLAGVIPERTRAPGRALDLLGEGMTEVMSESNLEEELR